MTKGKVGIDSVSLVFPIEGADFSALGGGQTLRSTDHESGRVSERQIGTLSASGLQVATQALMDGRARVIVSGSLPKVVNGHNLNPLDLEDVGPVVRDVVVPELASVVQGLDVEKARFSRIDSVTDLACDDDDIGPVLTAFEAVPIRKGVRKSLLRSTTERPETLMAMNKNGAMRAYNKGLEAAIRKVSRDLILKEAPALRIEGQSRVDWLKAMGCRELRDVERFPENVVGMHLKRVTWAGMDRGVSTMSTWVEELARHCRAQGISDTVRHRAQGYVLDVACGLSPKVGKNQATLYRRIVREAGIQPADVRQPSTVEVSYRLDFKRGEVVRDVA